jgi:hypothetical protein
MTTIDDDELRKRFAELKRHDARKAPDFAKMMDMDAPRPKKRSPWRVVVGVASLAAAAMVVVWCGAQSMMQSDSSSASAPVVAAAPTPTKAAGGEDREKDNKIATHSAPDPMPLDFLLEMPSSRGVTTSIGSNPIKGW